MKSLIVRFVREEEGQDLIEYALLASVIAIGSMAVMPGVSTAINGVFTKVSTCLATPASCTP
jgi:pilus assembly protein Flp/PilA